MVPSYRVFGANRVSRRPSLLIAVPRPKKAGQSCTSGPGIERTAQKRLGDATRLASVGCLACGFGPDGAATLLDRRAGRIAACLYDPEFRHQRNLAHRDPWQQHRWKLRDSGHHRNRGAPLQHFDWDLDAVSSRRLQTASTSRERSNPRLMAPALALNSAF